MLDHPVSPMYSHELSETICARIAQGEPLAQICREEGMPDDRTVRRWVDPKSRYHHPQFANEYAAARDMGFDALAEECLQIADTPVVGDETLTKPDGSIETRRGDMLGHRKLQIEVRLKLLAKWDPKRYGEKLETTHQAGQSLLDMVLSSYKAPPSDVPSTVAVLEEDRRFDPTKGLHLVACLAHAGGPAMLTRRLEEGDSAVD